MTKRILSLVAAVSVFAGCVQDHARERVRSDRAEFSKIATAKSGIPALELVSEVIKETYCESPDPDLFTLRLLLRLSFTNISDQEIILERGRKSVPVVRISKTAEDAVASQFETTIDNQIITSNQKARIVRKKPPLGSFVILTSGQRYETTAEVSIPVSRTDRVTSIISTGSHYLQVGVWTWDESRNEAEARRKVWQREGFLWFESMFSKPMQFTVSAQGKRSDCRCEHSRISESDAIAIASEQMQASNRATASYKSVALAQGCEWQIVFEPRTRRREKPSVIFIIDRDSGNILGEFH